MNSVTYPQSVSYVENVRLVMTEHLNGYGRMFGGYLICWMDETATAAGKRHTKGISTTALMDNIQFYAPILERDSLIISAFVTWTGNTSFEVKVEVHRWDYDDSRTLVAEGYFVMVALDEKYRHEPIPGLLCETPEEQEAFRLGKARMDLRKQQRLLEKSYAEQKFSLGE